MDYDESIPPSDAEEAEEAASSTSAYWETASSAIKRNQALLRDDHRKMTDSAIPLLLPYEGGAIASPPRKRLKLSSTTPEAEVNHFTGNHAVQAKSPLVLPSSTPSSSSLHGKERSRSTNQVLSKVDEAIAVWQQDDTVGTINHTSPPEGLVEDRASTSSHAQDEERHGFFDGAPLSPATTSPRTPPLRNDTSMAPSEHQDSSVDPFLLFTPPTSTWGSHSRTDHLSSQVGVEREVIKPIIASSAASQTPSFPCTPTNIRSISSRSPVPREQSRSPSSVSASLPHDHLLQSGPSLQANSDIPAALQLSDHEAGRYSLRTRKAQQLKPYGYDKLRYKKQMRHIPEAIVKLRSPRRPRREHSLSSQHAIPSSDAEFEGDTSNTEDSDGGRRRPPQKSPQRIENNDSSHEQSDSSDHPSKKGWIPAAFDLAFSSDEDERKKKTVSRVPVTVNQQGSKRRRKRPFPMSKKQLGKLPATLDLHDSDSEVRPLRVSTRADGDNTVSDTREPPLIRQASTTPPSSPQPWIPDDPGGFPEFDWDPLQSGPPTSSSVGRTSDMENGLTEPQSPPLLSLSVHPTVEASAESVLLTSSEEEDSPSDEMDDKTRKQWKAARRVMPAVMLKKAYGNVNNITRSQKPKLYEKPPAVGQVRKKIGEIRNDIVIRGDSESSDSDHDYGGFGSSHQLDVHVGIQRTLSFISISSGSDVSEASIQEEIPDDEVNQWISHPHEWQKAWKDHMHEDSLVDYMLAGTRVYGSKKPSKVRNRDSRPNTSNPRGPRLAPSGLSVTVGARKHGHPRQTHIQDHMGRASKRGSHRRRDSAPQANTNSPHPEMRASERNAEYQIVETSARNSDRKRKKASVGLYTFHGQGRLTTGRRQTDHVTVDAEYELPSTRPARFIPNFQQRRKTVSTTDVFFTEDEDELRNTSPSPTDNASIPLEHLLAASRHSSRLRVDADIPSLPLGVAFASDTYLGRGQLKELLHIGSTVEPQHPPPNGYIGELSISHTTPIPQFVAAVANEFEKIVETLSNADASIGEIEIRSCSHFFQTTWRHLTWFAVYPPDGERVLLVGVVRQALSQMDKLVLSPGAARDDRSFARRMILDMRWATIEMACRIQQSEIVNDDPMDIKDLIIAQMEDLRGFDLLKGFESILLASTTLDYSNLHTRIAELWVCLIHLLHSGMTRISFWDCFDQALHKSPEFISEEDKHKSSEAAWKALYIICALSHFSVHGATTSSPQLAPSWEFVARILNLVPIKQDTLSGKAVQKRRDKYLSLLVQRCSHLHHKWQWNLKESRPVISQLCEAFRSRRFGNLLHEEAEFPDFLREHDLRLLYSHSRRDTAFVTLLKLVVRAIDPLMQCLDPLNKESFPADHHKLLSILVPVGSVQFAKGTPATPRESSMLINRLSAVAVAMVLSPSPGPCNSRISQARRYVDFKQMDLKTRRACIRGLMYYACILRQFRVPLDELLKWLTVMTDILVSEFGDPSTTAKDRIVLCIQMLLGCVRTIVETPGMVKQASSQYPEPSLLAGAWVRNIFAPTTKLLEISTTRQELIRLALAYLDARSIIVPRPRRPQFVEEVEEESQESYADMDQFDFDDPELAAALGASSESATIQDLESRTCTVLSKDVWPIVNKCVYKDLNELASMAEMPEANFTSVATSIQCWVRCAGVQVQNGQREWSWYFEAGIPTKQLKQPIRTKIVLRYKLTILEWDAPAYMAYKDVFLEDLFQALTVPEVTFEHDYVSAIISLDRLKHPLLVDLPLGSVEDFKLTKAEYLNVRKDLIGHMFYNLEARFKHESGDYALKDQNRMYLGFIKAMFSDLMETFESLNSDARDEYGMFCRGLFDKFCQHPLLMLHSKGHEFHLWLAAMDVKV